MSRSHHHTSPSDSLSTLSTAFGVAVAPLSHALSTLGRMITVARARRDLRDLDERMLRDIGVTRLDVEREGNRRFWDIAERTDD